ncbi:hypothetical protein TNCV_1806791 [Trichonephila clavipes]|nr:hypothetical protein TNCV_1806791 [Trichonephila clavipes]
MPEANLKSKRPFCCAPLTPEPETRHLASPVVPTQDIVVGMSQVGKVFVFSVESRFVLGTDDNRVGVWRRPGEWYNSPIPFYVPLPAQLVPMVWGVP